MTEAITKANGETKLARGNAREPGLKGFLSSPAVMKKLAEVGNAAMKPEALIRLTLMAASRNPKLLKCTPESVLRSLLDAAELKIAPGGLQGRGYLVPRWNNKIKQDECHFDPGWRGLIDIARRSGQIETITAHVVRERDKFNFAFGTNETIEHTPYMGKGDAGEVVAAYAIAKFKGGGHQAEILLRADLDKIMAVSASKDRNTGEAVGPWADWYDEMARKSAVRRLAKYLPYEPEMEHAVRASLAADGEIEDVIDGATMGAAERAAALDAELEAPALEQPKPSDVVQHDADGVVVEAK